MNKIISYEEKIEEVPIFLEYHENQISKRIDSLTLEKPIFLIRQNSDTFDFEGLPVTKNILKFLRENKDQNLDYDIYIGYSFKPITSFKSLKENEDPVEFKRITEKEFMETEKKWWGEETQETSNPILEAAREFLNWKKQNGRKYYK